MLHLPTRSLSVLGVLVVCALAWPVSAEETAPPSPVAKVTIDDGETASFDETVDVRLVNVEVYVTDRKGRPIEGLTADDFELFEDARPVAISHFAERSGSIVEAGAPATSAASQTASLPFAVDESTLESGIPPEPTYLVLYFDNAHLRSQGRRQLIDDIQTFLADTDIPHRQVLIASQTPGLHAEAPFGSTHAELIDALQRIDTLPALGEELDRERDLIYLRLNEVWETGDFASDAIQLDECDELTTVGTRDVSNYARGVEGRVATTLRHLTTLSSALAGLPGIKHLLYLGDGLQLEPGIDLFEFIKATCPQRARDVDNVAQRSSFTRSLERLTRHANANRISITALAAQGPMATSRSDINWTRIDFAPDAANDFIRTSNLRDSLNFLATETGGRALFNYTRFDKPLDEVAQDMSTYYSLAYQPEHYGDDETYLIDVRLKKNKRSKYRVRHRLSYRDKPADERMADRLQSALTLGLEENPLSAELSHGIIESSEKDTFSVPIAVKVPLDKLVFLPRDGSHLGRLRMQIVARDADGRATAFHQKQFQVELDPALDGVASGEHTFAVDLEMREGEHIIAVGLRDETGRETSYLAKKLVVAPTSPDQMAEAGAPQGAPKGTSAED